MTRSDEQRIRDILKAIQSIHRSKALLEKHSEDHEIEETVLAAVTFQLFIIGEAVKSLSAIQRETLPEVPWSKIMRQRDLIGHHYFTVDAGMIWETLDKPLKQLHTALKGLSIQD
ncbi:uncharacterized protein with HEPN domain [Aurantimicrobium minutum]|uniref:HepT-like ribonuclease domain-containing protein n=1 Tax=Aurantimicrobium minutum TaxID=708131 RepID=UPI0024761E58|nr:HepT-like ribonuclease domain-containing protein [Aurantimicrobium minutum]MDH6277345.1 uncharacterized protein with HEPN domain [Aurantimicrobium minutum]